MRERFVSEAIKAVEGSFDLTGVPVGEPALPRQFIWRGTTYEVDEVLDRHREVGRDTTHGSNEHYLRKHWFCIRTTSGHEMHLYFERQARSKAQRKTRWWLYTVLEPENPLP